MHQVETTHCTSTRMSCPLLTVLLHDFLSLKGLNSLQPALLLALPLPPLCILTSYRFEHERKGSTCNAKS